MNEVARARELALLELTAIRGDPVRAESVKPKAIEVRFNHQRPDVALHLSSGGVTQGGYLFFIEDLEHHLGTLKVL